MIYPTAPGKFIYDDGQNYILGSVRCGSSGLYLLPAIQGCARHLRYVNNRITKDEYILKARTMVWDDKNGGIAFTVACLVNADIFQKKDSFVFEDSFEPDLRPSFLAIDGEGPIDIEYTIQRGRFGSDHFHPNHHEYYTI